MSKGDLEEEEKNQEEWVRRIRTRKRNLEEK